MSDFWSRRRAAVEQEQQAELVALEVEARAETEAELEARSDAELLAEFDLPEPEALDSSEAVREFLTHTLPQRLKTRALRRLWRLNPVLANIDGLVDYGEDFTDSATVVENLQTAYQVGKGMLKHIEEMARQAEEAEASEARDAARAAAGDLSEGEAADLAQAEAEAAEVAAIEPVAPVPYVAPDYDEPEEATAPRASRMTFQFEA